MVYKSPVRYLRSIHPLQFVKFSTALLKFSDLLVYIFVFAFSCISRKILLIAKNLTLCTNIKATDFLNCINLGIK